MIKGYLINAKTKEITVEEIDTVYPEANALIGCDWIECGWTNYETNDTLFVDEEGLLKEQQFFFEIKGVHRVHQPFAGNGFIAGCDIETGDSTDVKMTLDEVKALVTFNTIQEIIEKV